MSVWGCPPDISYGIECSVECFDSTGDILTFYHHFNEDVDIASLVDNRPFRRGDPQENLRGLARTYLKPYNKWFFGSPSNPAAKAWCVASASERYGRQSAEVIDALVVRYISNMLAEDRDPAHRGNQQRWIEQSKTVMHGRHITAQLARKAWTVDIDDLSQALFSPTEFSLRLPVREALPIVWEDGECSPDEQWNDDPSYVSRTSQRRLLSKSELKDRRKIRMSVLKKSSAFLSRLIGTDQVSMFVTGREITVRGNRFTFAVRKNNILSEDYGALHISVFDNATDVRMFDLCWYVERTPAMDQISALIMAVRVGDEDEIIRVGNFLRVNHEGLAQHEHLKEWLPAPYSGPLGIHDPCTNDDPRILFPDDDRIQRLTMGTTEYHRSHPSVYQDFSRRIRRRWAVRFPQEVSHCYRVDHPETVRPFIDGRVLRDLLPDQRTMQLRIPILDSVTTMTV